MKISYLSAAFVAALITTACGGGGGGGDSSPTPVPVVPVVVVTPPPAPIVPPVVVVTPPPVVPVPVVVTVTCPDGSTATSAINCPAVGTGPVALQGSVMSPIDLDNGVTIRFNGDLVPSSVTVLLKQGNSILASTATMTGGKDLTFKPVVRLAYGQSYVVLITATDTIGRAVAVTLSFSTMAMGCSSNAVFSNPVPFSEPLKTCVASIGVQALVTPSFNTMTDTSCTPTVGSALSAACRAYMANGTILIANTSVIVQNNPTVWLAYIGADRKSNLVLLDATTLKPIGAMVLPGDLLWIIGNPTGAAIRVNVGGVQKTQQARWGGAAIVLI